MTAVTSVIALSVAVVAGLLARDHGAAVGDQAPDVDPELTAATASHLYPALNTEETQQP